MSSRNTLPNNLRLGVNGRLYCQDGQDVDTYVKTSIREHEVDLPTEIVLITRADFLKLCRRAEFNAISAELIRAA